MGLDTCEEALDDNKIRNSKKHNDSDEGAGFFQKPEEVKFANQEKMVSVSDDNNSDDNNSDDNNSDRNKILVKTLSQKKADLASLSSYLKFDILLLLIPLLL